MFNAAIDDMSMFIDENEKRLSKVIEVVAENYTQYHECKLKVDAWVEWYKQQKQISDSIK